MSFVSILIPTLDEAAWVEHTLKTARASLNAAGVDGELIVADGGSTDATVERARRLADGVVQADRGRASQLNAAADAAQGDIFVMLHADCLLNPAAVAGICQTVGAGACGGWFQIEIVADRHAGPARWGFGWMAWGINFRTRLFRTATADQAIFCGRRAFEAVGGLPDVQLLEGNLFARRLRDYGRVDILPANLRISGRRWQRNGLLRTMVLMYAIRAFHRLGVPVRYLAWLWHRSD